MAWAKAFYAFAQGLKPGDRILTGVIEYGANYVAMLQVSMSSRIAALSLSLVCGLVLLSNRAFRRRAARLYMGTLKWRALNGRRAAGAVSKATKSC